MEVVNCLLCGHGDRHIRFHGRERLHSLPGRFTLVECARCHFLYLSPRPDSAEIAQYYPADYGFYQMGAHLQGGTFHDKMRQLNLKRRCETVLRYKSHGDLLDFGCGSGEFLATMQALPGWRVQGLEPYAPDIAERAHQRHGITVNEGTLENASICENSFDVVTLWEVLEHVRHPLEDLRRIHALLRPHGVIVLSLPNRNSFAARIFGPSWVGLDVPRHFSVFSPAQIEQAMLTAGFRRPEIFAERGIFGSAQAELLCILASLYMWIVEEEYPRSRRRFLSSAFMSVVTNPAAVMAIFLLTLPHSYLARTLNRASQMVVVARRD